MDKVHRSGVDIKVAFTSASKKLPIIEQVIILVEKQIKVMDKVKTSFRTIARYASSKLLR